MNIRIGTRKSKLAQIQTDYIIDRLKEKYDFNFEKVLIQTEGDSRLDVTLDKIGGKGLFIKEIEFALLHGDIEGAVHSMKDVPYEVGDSFKIAAMPIREDVRDAFVSMNGVPFEALPKGAKVGTSSIRRSAQLKLMRPDLNIVPIRGNVETRISKIQKENLDGIILAAAGLKRLGMEEIITNYFDPFEFVPAVGQGALGVEILKEKEYREVFESLDNKEVRLCVEAERSFMRRLNGGCHSLIGAYGVLQGEDLYMVGTFEVGSYIVKKDILGKKEEHLRLGELLAEKILKGAL